LKFKAKEDVSMYVLNALKNYNIINVIDQNLYLFFC